MTERIVHINGQGLWTESLGDPAAAPVLLIGGAGAHAHFWTDSFCRPLLEAGFFVIRYDHRDVGLSEACEQEYELQDLVEDAIGILNGYNLSAAHVVGHSMGGYIGQLMAITHPDRMLSFTAISTGPVGETEELVKPHTEEEKEMFQKTWLILIRNRPTDDFEKSYEGFAAVWERLNGCVALDENLARTYTKEMFNRSHFPVKAHRRHMNVMQKVAETLKERKDMFLKITLPTLIIHGEQDYLVPVARGGGALAQVLPHAEVEIVPKMGHMLFDRSIEQLIANRIVTFISKERQD